MRKVALKICWNISNRWATMSPELFGQVVHILEADPVISIQITKSVGRFTFYEKVQANESNIGLAVTTKKLQNIIKLW